MFAAIEASLVSERRKEAGRDAGRLSQVGNGHTVSSMLAEQPHGGLNGLITVKAAGAGGPASRLFIHRNHYR